MKNGTITESKGKLSQMLIDKGVKACDHVIKAGEDIIAKYAEEIAQKGLKEVGEETLT
jgi:hypothetical protein